MKLFSKGDKVIIEKFGENIVEIVESKPYPFNRTVYKIKYDWGYIPENWFFENQLSLINMKKGEKYENRF